MTGSATVARNRAARAAGLLAKRPWLLYLALTPFAHPILETILFGDRALQTAHDVFDDDVPRLFSIPADWRAFGPSLWDTHLTGGNALLAQFALPPLAPDVVLSFLLPPYAAYTLNAALMAFVAGVSMHLFLRGSLRLPAIACFAGGALALFGFWHYILGYAALAAPLALLWSERAAAPEASRGDTVRLALLVAFLAISSQVQVVAILALVALAWALVPARGLRDGVVRAARWFRGWLAGAALAAPVLLTLLVAVGDSQRTIWAIDPPADPLGQWINDVGAIVFGVPVASLERLSPLYGTFFPGIVGLLLLVVSLAMPRPERRSRAALGLLASLLVADLVAILVMPLQADSTLLKSFQFVRVMHLVPAAVAMNVALALAWLLRASGDSSRAEMRQGRRAVVAGGVGAATVAIAAQAVVILQAIGRRLGDGLDLGRLQPATAGWLLAAAAFAAGTLIVGAAALLLARWMASDGRRRSLAGPIAIVLVVGLAVGQALFTRAAVLTRSGFGTWEDWVPATAAQEYIAEQPGGGRVVSVLEHANRSLVAGLAAADGYQTVYPLRYHRLFGLLIKPQTDGSEGLAAYFGGWGNRAYAFTAAIDEQIADLLGIRWVAIREEAIDPDLAKRAGEQVEAPPWLTLRVELDGVRVYENADAFARAFVVHDVASHPDAASVVAAMTAASREDLRTRGFVIESEAPTLAPVAGDGAPDSGDVVEPVVETPDRLGFRTQLERPGILVIADTYARGWVAEIDGRPAPLFPVDIALRGVSLPQGEHVVTLRYRPVETYVGMALSVLTALTMLGWLLAPRLNRRRNAPTADARS